MENRQMRLCDYLRTGKRSVIDIMTRLNIADPRSIIRDLRKKGVQVCDEWRKTTKGNRYKVYWIVWTN